MRHTLGLLRRARGGEPLAITVGVHEAKTHLSRLLDRVSPGEEVIITRAGQPVARLVGISTTLAQRTPGSAAGRLVLHDDPEEPLPNRVLDNFEVR